MFNVQDYFDIPEWKSYTDTYKYAHNLLSEIDYLHTVVQ